MESPQTEADKNEAALREAMVLGEGVRRLGRMFAMKSLNRNLENEDEAVRRNYEIADREMFGVEPSSQGEKESEMEITSAGNVTINYGQMPQQGAPSAAAADGAQPEAASKSMIPDWLKKAAAIAAIGAGGAAIPIVYDQMTEVKNPPAAQADFSPTELDLLPPDTAVGS